MKTNDELIEELKAWGWSTEAARQAFTHEQMAKIRDALTQRDAEVKKREQELIEQICTIVKDGIDDWWSYQVTDKIKALTPYPTEDTSGKTN